MREKRTIVMIVVAVLLTGIWIAGNYYVRKTWPDAFVEKPRPTLTSETQPTTDTSPDTNASTSASTTEPTTAMARADVASTTQQATAPSASMAAGYTVLPPEPGTAMGVELGSAQLDDPNYAMQLRLTSAGGAIERVTLNQFRRGEDFLKKKQDRGIYVSQEPYAGYEFARSLSTRSVTVDGKPLDVGSVAWSLVETGPTTKNLNDGKHPEGVPTQGTFAKFRTVIGFNGEKVLELSRTFTIFPKATLTQGYEVAVENEFKNLSNREITVSSTLNGPTLPPREAFRPPDRQVLVGYRTADMSVYPAAHQVESFSTKSPTLDLTTDKDKNHIVWAGTSSVYFNAFVLFDQPQEIVKVAAEAKELENSDAEARPILMTFDTAPAKLAAGEAKQLSMWAFFGPRWREVLNNDSGYYANAPRDYAQTLVVKSGFCSACAFDWLINGLVKLLNVFHWLAGGFVHAGDWGIAIILLVALVRTCLHPITKRSQVQMMRMGKMGPEMQKLKEKYADDKEGFSKAQMQLMKEQGIGPLLGCLPMFLQMPIWIALYQSLQSTFELRQASFLWGFTWIKDLSKPDFLIPFGYTVQLPMNMHLEGINVLPLLMAVIFNIQARIQNKLQPAATPEQESQKKMMMWMSTLLFPVFLYNGPSGLNLYILTSTLVGIVESKIIRDHIKEREAAEKAAGLLIVDEDPRARNRKGGIQAEAGKKPGRLAGFMQRMQDRVEEVRKEEQKKRKK